MDKLDYAILNALQEGDALTKLQAVSRKQLLEEVDIRPQNLFLRLQKLQTAGLVHKGINDGREHTFFITQDGINHFREELG